jgi:hypothetical protein
MFFIVPLIFLGLSYMFEQKAKGLTVLGAFIVVIIGLGCIYLGYWCQFKGGKQHCTDCFAKRERRRVMYLDLPEDMDYLKTKIAALVEYTGLPADEEDEAEAHDVVKADKKDVADGQKDSDDTSEEVEI